MVTTESGSHYRDHIIPQIGGQSRSETVAIVPADMKLIP